MANQRVFSEVAGQTLAIFVDYHNLEGSLRNAGYRVDLPSLCDYLATGRRLTEAFVYVGFNPQNAHEDERFHKFLKSNGFFVRTKQAKIRPDGSLKCDLDIELALDVVDYVQHSRPGIVLLVSGDGDFLQLVNWLRLRGVRVEVASTPGSLSQDLFDAANGYIDLCRAIEEMEAQKERLSRKEVKEHVDGNA